MNKTRSLNNMFFEYVLALTIGGYLFLENKNDINILVLLLYVDIVMTSIIFIFSLIHNNSSVYDPYWSIIPPFILLMLMDYYSSFDFVTTVMFIGVATWAIRLTTNWYRDFEGLHHEDFRYVDFRKKFPKTHWIVSYLAIHMFPTIIVLISMYPVYYVLHTGIKYEVFVYLGTITMIGAAIIQFVSDEQIRIHKKNPKNIGIALNQGLWKYSRHPNYFGELLFWFGVLLLGFSAGITPFMFVGFVGMLLLFNFYSVPKMEKRQLQTKQNYQEIISKVPRLFIRKGKV